MRTTVELKPEHRSALLALAARRGQKGFSQVLEEAIDTYLRNETDRKKRRARLLSLEGTLRGDVATDLRRTALALRVSWR
jgi:hypothetical protein